MLMKPGERVRCHISPHQELISNIEGAEELGIWDARIPEMTGCVAFEANWSLGPHRTSMSHLRFWHWFLRTEDHGPQH